MTTSKTELKRPVASPIHTIGLLAIITAWAWHGVRTMALVQSRSARPLILTYFLSMILEWLVVGYIIWGVRREGASLRELMGENGSRARDVLRDVLIAIGFWIIVIFTLAALGLALRVGRPAEVLRFLAPHGTLEIVCWILLSCTAGFCEEIIFRGYLQRQFISMSGSVPVGILLSAVIFGSVHLYQGGKRTIMIGVFGAMLGTLAYLRGSLRPGMMAHAWQDSLVGLLIRFIPK